MTSATPNGQLNRSRAPSQELLQAWIQKHADLVGQERIIEQEEARLLLSKCSPRLLERNGLAILGLGVVNVAVGLGGKALIELERPAAFHESPQFPPHSFRPGDIVQLEDHAFDHTQSKGTNKAKGKGKSGSDDHRDMTVAGVVYRIADTRIIIAASRRQKGSSEGADGGLPELPVRIRVVKVANDATFDRMEWGLTRLAKLLNVTVRTSKRSNDATSSDEEEAAEKIADVEGNQAGPSSSSGILRNDLPSTLVPALIGRIQPQWEDLPEDIPSRFINPNLNASQMSAVKFAMGAKHFALIHGPPGTGKTTAVAEIVLQMALTQQKRILVCGASNLAADNLLERIIARGADDLAKARIGITRLGHPARVLPSLVETTLDQQAQASSEGELLKDVRKELEQALSALRPKEAAGNKSTSSRGQASAKSQRVRGSERKERREEIRLLRKEFRKRERTLLRSVLKKAGIVVATCHGAGAKQLDGIDFGAVIIDEACQATEAACWIPVLKAKPDGVLILAGDHLQLPPTVKGFRPSQMKQSDKNHGAKKFAMMKNNAEKVASAEKADELDAENPSGSEVEDQDQASQAYSEEAKRASEHVKETTLRPPRSLETTLFSRLLGMYGPGCKILLDTQYRMNNEIMTFPNEALYEGKIKADASCATIRLTDLEGYTSVQDDELERAPIVFYDTAGCEMFESQGTQDGSDDVLPSRMDSRANAHEVELVLRHVETLVKCGLDPKRISVLSPYNLQVSALSDRLRGSAKVGQVSLESIVVGSIDSMQGMENDVVILSLVRSNETRTVGFLAEHRRLNVAMTRPKRQLCVIGDSETISGAGDHYLKHWMQHLEQHAFVEPVVP